MPTTVRVWRTRHAWNAEKIVPTERATYRMTVKRDAYNDQCVAKAEFWKDGLVLVLTRSIGELPAKRVSYTWPEERAEPPLLESLDMLFASARWIVEGGA